MNKLTIALIVLALSTGCVSKKKFDELNNNKSKLEVEKAEAQKENKILRADKQSLQQQLDANAITISGLIKDTTDLNNLYRELNKEYGNLSKISAADAQQLQAKLQELSKLKKELLEKDTKLQADQEKITNLLSELELREARMLDLEQRLNKQDETVQQLKEKITNALLSFDSSQLTVEMKNGKIYVSLSEKLLFKSGSYNIDPNGVDALSKLGSILSTQKDVDIVVEGHSDNVPYSGSGALVDNWDLSAKRSTSVVRILAKNGVDQSKLSAAGRSSYVPVVNEDTKEARSINRRIEIIIIPDLSELFDIIQKESK